MARPPRKNATNAPPDDANAPIEELFGSMPPPRPEASPEEAAMARRREITADVRDLMLQHQLLDGAMGRGHGRWAERRDERVADGASEADAAKALMAAGAEDTEQTSLRKEVARQRTRIAGRESRLVDRYGAEEAKAIVARIDVMLDFDRRLNGLKADLNAAANAGDLARARGLQARINRDARRRINLMSGIADQDEFTEALAADEDAEHPPVLAPDERMALEEETDASHAFGRAMERDRAEALGDERHGYERPDGGWQPETAASMEPAAPTAVELAREAVNAIPDDHGVAAQEVERLEILLAHLADGPKGLKETETQLEQEYDYVIPNEANAAKTPWPQRAWQDVRLWLRTKLDPGLSDTLVRYEDMKEEWRVAHAALTELEAKQDSETA